MTIAPQRPADFDGPGRHQLRAAPVAAAPAHLIPAQQDAAAEPFRIVFICTGKHLPLAQRGAAHLAPACRTAGRSKRRRVQVASAGVRPVVEELVHAQARSQLAPWGLDGVHTARFAARQLDSAVVEGVDLVLGAMPRHRSTSWTGSRT